MLDLDGLSRLDEALSADRDTEQSAPRKAPVRTPKQSTPQCPHLRALETA